MEKSRAEQSARQRQTDWEMWESQFGPEPMSDAERLLTEVDQLNDARLPNGEHAPQVLDEQLKNLISATQEAAMPYAVTRTEHTYKEDAERDEHDRPVGAFMWLGKTAVENTVSGYRYHRHEAALKRVDIEMDEARESATLQPGRTRIFISPRMTRTDATLAEAKAEHLAADDAVRTSTVVEDGTDRRRILDSLLVRNIPLEAWVDLLEDPGNVFGKSITVRRDGSAASVMEVHRELEIDSDQLEHGPVSVVEAVVPYIVDPDIRADVEAQLERFHESQGDMHAKAVNIAKRWQDFEVALADSVHYEHAVPETEAFINEMLPRWNAESLEMIAAHELPNGRYRMTRELAATLEKAKQNLLWSRAAVIVGNEKVLEQLDSETAERIYRAEMFIQLAAQEGRYEEVRHLEVLSSLDIAKANIGVGGGCAGDNEGDFDDDDSNPWRKSSGAEDVSPFAESKVGKVSKSKCVVENCPTRPKTVLVGGCGVCLGRCQKLFDAGKDPTKMGSAGKQAGKAVATSMFAVQRSPEQNHEFALAA